MKVAILTLRVDNNYGGNLQRYALSHVLKNMGHDVNVLYFRSTWSTDSCKKKVTKSLKNCIKILLGRKINHIFYWKYEDCQWEEKRKYTYPFFCKYVKHSPLIYSLKSLKRHIQTEMYEAFVVGSDQVWRKAYTERWGVDRFFLDFAPENTKRIAYAASFGRYDMEYNTDELLRLKKLYQQFDAVSVREDTGISILENQGWKNPKAIQVLDPTMLLTREHYMQLIAKGNTHSSNGNMFCYILDITDEISSVIDILAVEKKLKPFYSLIEGNDRMSIEQWLRSFADAEYVVTDSYHGVVFSLIFNKPFYILENKQRGNARFESLKNMFGLSIDNSEIDWKCFNSIVEEYKGLSTKFLLDNL